MGARSHFHGGAEGVRVAVVRGIMTGMWRSILMVWVTVASGAVWADPDPAHAAELMLRGQR